MKKPSLPVAVQANKKGAQASCLSLQNVKATDEKVTGKMPVLGCKIGSIHPLEQPPEKADPSFTG
jgi:hypothetical protein